MPNPKRILLLAHPQYDPRRGRLAAPTEYDVWRALKRLGHHVDLVFVRKDLPKFLKSLGQLRPDVVFNLLEEFRDEAVFDFHLVSVLEALGIPFTGVNPRGLIVSRNKLWTAHLSAAAHVKSPRTTEAGRPGELPVLLKYTREHASLHLTQGNVVRTRSEYVRCLQRLRTRYAGDIVAQEFIAGREVSVGVLGHSRRMTALVPWQLSLPRPEDIATHTVKFQARHRRVRGIRAGRFKSPLGPRLQRDSKALFALLDLNGYARFDYRVSEAGEPYLIDVNANPCLARDEDFAQAGRASGFSFVELIQEIVRLADFAVPRR